MAQIPNASNYATAVRTNAATGVVAYKTNSTTLLSSGLFYQNSSNQWVRSAPSLTITPQGAAESRGTRHQVKFLPDFANSSTGLVQITTGDGKKISTMQVSLLPNPRREV